MDYEKKYKEALERARQFSEHPLQEDRDSIVEYIFPELKESEDEKIRKALIRFHKSTIDIDGIKGADVIAWLEKQGEIGEDLIAKKFLIDKGYPIDANGTFPTYDEMYNIIKEGLEKQGEQKSADSYCQENCKGFQETGECFADWDAEKKELKKIEQKSTEWNEEDENTIKVLMNIIRKSEMIDSIIYTDSLKEKLYDWLKSIKQRIGG